MKRPSLRPFLFATALAFSVTLVPATAHAQDMGLAVSIDRAVPRAVNYSLIGAPPRAPFALFASTTKGSTKMGGWPYQGGIVPQFHLDLGSPVKQIVTGTTDGVGSAKGSLLPPAVLGRQKGGQVYFQSIALHVTPSAQPIIRVLKSNVAGLSGS
jgi:hypothetical protein